MNRSLLSRVAPGLLGGLLGLSFACSMENPAFDLGDAGETRASGDGDGDPNTSAEGNTSVGDGDGDSTPGDGDPTTGDGDGDPSTSGDGDGEPTTGDGDGDPSTSGDGDGDMTSSTTVGDGDGDSGGECGDGVVDPGEECDDGNTNDGDGCSGECTIGDGGDGDGDGDGDPNMMMVVECALDLMPETCQQCLGSFCCEPVQLACAGNPKCLCMLPCLAENIGEQQCAFMCMMADGNTTAQAVATVDCAAENCNAQCIGP